MYNSNYEDYMRNVLGYSVRPQNMYQIQDNMYEMPIDNDYQSMSLEGLYPEIYRMIYPMVQKVCMRAIEVINEETIVSMTDEVYNAMVEQETRKSNSEVKTNSSQNYRRMEETRQNNFMLRDLIRILIINELLRRRRRPHMRPDFFGRMP